MKKFLLFVALFTTTALWAQSNVIIYTASEKLLETTDTNSAGLHMNAFNVTISSHTFVNGTGIIIFDGDVTTIGELAFYECHDLTSITIPNSVTTIGSSAFHMCSGLTKTNYTGTIEDWCNIKFVDFNSNPNSYSHHFFINDVEITNLIIPNSVTTIEDYAFSCCDGLASVTIPNTVTTIGQEAFFNCSNLTSVTIGNSVTTIGAWAFEYCTGLTSVTIPKSVTTIREQAFNHVNNVVYNGTATGSPWGAKCVNGYIDGYLVYSDAAKTTLCGCSSAATGAITIPNTVTTIRESAFSKCAGLTSVTIPNSVTTIGSYAFYECTGLTLPLYNAICFAYMPVAYEDAYNIPDGIKQIAGGAFCDCIGLASVTIPNSVTTIGEWAFYNCAGLTSITCYAANPPLCGRDCWWDKSFPLYVPAQSVDAYKQAEEWKYFTPILPITAENVEVTEPEAEPTNNTVVISWPAVEDGETYTIEIRKGSELICTLTFNANGQLLNISFAAPARDGKQGSRYANATATGWTYTITGLEANTDYNYKIVVKDEGGHIIDTQTGSFKTIEEGMAIYNVFDSQNADAKVESKKFFNNGKLIIRRGNHIYNAQGKVVVNK